MAKTIKFNLICDNNPVRTVDDLRNNFSVEDILKYFNNGLLERWLSVRGYVDEYQKVSAINKNDSDISVTQKLIEIFDVEADEDKIRENVFFLEYEKEKKELFDIYRNERVKVEQIIDDYRAGYEKLVKKIYDNPNDISIIKGSIKEIVEGYNWAFVQNHRALFWNIYNISPLTIMCLLMNEKTRDYYLPINVVDENGQKYRDIDIPDFNGVDKKTMYDNIRALIVRQDFSNLLAGNLRDFCGQTDGYWKDIEVEGKYMIIKMEKGSFVRSSNKHGEEFGVEIVNNNFIILDGIDYKCNNMSHHLLYMEV